MSFRRFFALLLALAMIAAPLGMPAMAQMTVAEPATQSRHGEMAGRGEGSQGSGHAQHGGKAAGGHCDEQQTPDHQGKAADKSCCVAMCVAVVVPAAAAELPAHHAVRERPASDLDPRGFLGEVATPPPRLA